MSRDTLRAIWKRLVPVVMHLPTAQTWRDIARDFQKLLQCPISIVAMDGKNIKIRAPSSSGRGFYNYKDCFSIVLLAVCDPYYNFALVDMGDNGRQNYSAVFFHSGIGEIFEDGSLNIPEGDVLPNTNIYVPFCFAAGKAFPSKVEIVKL